MNSGVKASIEDTVGVGTLRMAIAGTQDVLELLGAGKNTKHARELL